jgi:hypothetical protein
VISNRSWITSSLVNIIGICVVFKLDFEEETKIFRDNDIQLDLSKVSANSNKIT